MADEKPELALASVVLYRDWFSKGLHLMLARSDNQSWAAFKESQFLSNRLPLVQGRTWGTLGEAYDAVAADLTKSLTTPKKQPKQAAPQNATVPNDVQDTRRTRTRKAKAD